MNVDSLLSNAKPSNVNGERQGIFHTNHQQDAYEYLLIILDIVHKHAKIDVFPCLVFSQENIKYSSIIRNTFYDIIKSPLM